jgi:hypothetical protein
MELDQTLANRRWLRGKDPFPHYVALDVLTPELYEPMEQEFKGLVAEGLDEEPGSERRFSRNLAGYDAYGLAFWPAYTGAFDLFLDASWREMLASLFEVETTDHVEVGLHHHPPGTGAGSIHHDLAPSGHEVDPDAPVRAVAMIFYVANPPYRGGGETGLYRTEDQGLTAPSVAVPPENNSILVFECTPHSLHAFLANTRERNSVHLWLHQSRANAAARWGEARIAP